MMMVLETIIVCSTSRLAATERLAKKTHHRANWDTDNSRTVPAKHCCGRSSIGALGSLPDGPPLGAGEPAARTRPSGEAATVPIWGSK